MFSDKYFLQVAFTDVGFAYTVDVNLFDYTTNTATNERLAIRNKKIFPIMDQLKSYESETNLTVKLKDHEVSAKSFKTEGMIEYLINCNTEKFKE